VERRSVQTKTWTRRCCSKKEKIHNFEASFAAGRGLGVEALSKRKVSDILRRHLLQAGNWARRRYSKKGKDWSFKESLAAGRSLCADLLQAEALILRRFQKKKVLIKVKAPHRLLQAKALAWRYPSEKIERSESLRRRSLQVEIGGRRRDRKRKSLRFWGIARCRQGPGRGGVVQKKRKISKFQRIARCRQMPERWGVSQEMLIKV